MNLRRQSFMVIFFIVACVLGGLVTGLVGCSSREPGEDQFVAHLSTLDRLAILEKTAENNTCEASETTSAQSDDSVQICHFPQGSPDNAHSIIIGKSALKAHVGHHNEDFLMTCGEESEENRECQHLDDDQDSQSEPESNPEVGQ